MTFWEKHKDVMAEDVTAERDRYVAEPIHATKRLQNAKAIAIDKIEADPQHREEFDPDGLERLARSLQGEGQLQPIRVRFASERGVYVIIAGERRWRAAKLAGLATVDCVVVEGQLTESDILRQQILENAMREDLKPTEQGKAFRDLMEKEGWNGKELAEQLNVHPSTVSRTLGLLELPAEVQGKVDRGQLSMTQALKARHGGAEPKPAKKRPSKEKKITTSVGITITLKARKLLKDEQVASALREALAELERAA